MKKFFLIVSAAVLLAACGPTEKQLRERANELCQYIPDHELLEQSRDYMTPDFYAVLDTMFYRLPAHEAMDHEWLYYFVTGNGGTIADYEVQTVTLTDADHAVATILVRQTWEDGSFDPESDVEEHRLDMERVNGVWLMADFDGHKADCIRYIANNRREQALREAISLYLTSLAVQYAQGELFIPTLMIVHETDSTVYGDFWIYWYTLAGDTLRTVSGGNHSGCMTVDWATGMPVITDFVQTDDGTGYEVSARRIFGTHYDIYHNMHANQDVREAVRQEQLREYILRHDLDIRYYQDYGWPAVAL